VTDPGHLSRPTLPGRSLGRYARHRFRDVGAAGGTCSRQGPARRNVAIARSVENS